jgi:predicted ATPase
VLGIVARDDPLAQMEGQVKKRRTLAAIKRILLRESLNRTLMVIFEDLHWIDEQTQDFLNVLVEHLACSFFNERIEPKLYVDSIGTTKSLLLVNYRPEYRHERSHKTY